MTQYVYKHVFTPSEQSSPQHTVYAVADCPVKAAILAQAFALSGGLAWKRFKQTIGSEFYDGEVNMKPHAWSEGTYKPWFDRPAKPARRAGEYIVEDGTARYEDKGMETFPPKACTAHSEADRDRVALAVWCALTEHQQFHAKRLAVQCSGIGDLDYCATMAVNPMPGRNELAVISFSSSKYERCMSLFVAHAKERGVNVRRGESAGRLLANWSALAECGVFGSRYRELYRAALAAQPA